MDKEIKEFFTKNSLQLALSAVGLLITVLNLYLTSQLAPLAQGIRDLEFKVHAIEDRNEALDPLVPRFLSLEESVKHMDATLNRMESKLDRHLETR